jgi:phage host-nuclease inhibitor protein Gam
MARAKSDSGLSSWADVDETLLTIGRLERQIAQIEGDAQTFIEEIKERAVADVKPLLERKKLLGLQLEHFCLRHREEMAGKSKKLNFGTVSFRQATRVVIKRIAECLEALKERGLLDCIRVKESPDKDRLRDLPDDVLAAVGAKRIIEDAFGYEVDRERVKLQEAA